MFSEIDRHRNEFGSNASTEALLASHEKDFSPEERGCIERLNAALAQLPNVDIGGSKTADVHEVVANASFNPSTESGPRYTDGYSPVREAEEITRQAALTPQDTLDPHAAARTAASSIEQLAEGLRMAGVK